MVESAIRSRENN